MTRDPTKIETGNTVITSEAGVYIFESRLASRSTSETKNSDLIKNLELTTSFLEIAKGVKDTRLLPKGWEKSGPYAAETHLSRIEEINGVKETVAWYLKDPGERTIRYKLPMTIGAVSEAKVTIMYQSIPPYYIRDRLNYDSPDINRFYYLVANLNTENTPIEDWTFRLSCTLYAFHRVL